MQMQGDRVLPVVTEQTIKELSDWEWRWFCTLNFRKPTNWTNSFPLLQSWISFVQAVEERDLGVEVLL